MTKRPKLYPGHQHQWADDLLGGPWVRCTVCGFEAPRWMVERRPPEQADRQETPA
jgi:hypothetical protein